MHFGECLEEDRLIQLTRSAYEQGVRTFVTSDVYGTGRADEMLGKALKGLDRDTYCLVTLLGHDIYDGQRQGAKGYQRFTNPELRGPEGYAEYMQRATQKCAERCGTDHFDMVMLHNPDSIGYTNPAVWEAMATLKEKGLSELVGIAPGPANGFVMDLIHCFENFGEQIDWAMVILNPLEPWPMRHVLPVAEQQKIDVITRVVDYGGMFHDIMRPGHQFKDGDHRAYRPQGWVDHAHVKLERLREIAKAHDLTLLQLSCQWDLAQPAVKSVAPTLIQEAGEGVKSIEEELKELAALPEKILLTQDEIAEIEKIGDNEGCMALKGASERNAPEDGETPDSWPVRPELLEVANRFGLNPGW